MNMFINCGRVEVASAVEIGAPPGRVWPFLTAARMDLPAPLLLRLGLPAPVACRPGPQPGTRECVSDRGVVGQRITEWVPPARLSFERVSDTAGLGRWVLSMRDTFTLEALPGGRTRLRRRTVLRPRCALQAPLLRWALAAIHAYVHRNFKHLAEG